MDPRGESTLQEGFFGGLQNTTKADLPLTESVLPLADPCVLPMDEGTCKQYTVLWYFHQEANHCRPFIFGGCGGNANQFPSKKKCELWCKRTTDPSKDVDQIQGGRNGEKKQVSTISKTVHAVDGMV
nr:PREDICTED: kunitz-type serine protease inhibitor nigrescinin-6 [Anolis carolinensis]XP_016849034.1 PREDICTED: kunitz-type serine protease inhibitor nigrescinin-6 [Anolis carolinensis]|eukprot:XP_016849033.1 PREDICTED: kunitz-type serine protease inhibitor nigrescinin-6 [Anolis carolinensis]